MCKGSYRVYIKLPFISYGIKMPRFNVKNTNSFCGFLCGMIMNILERKRYKRFVKKKSYKYKWQPKEFSLCPTYFSLFGLINIVRHAEELPESWFAIKNKPCVQNFKASPFCESPDKLSSFGIIDGDINTGRLVEVDYGDFTIYSHFISDVKEIDYK